MGATFKITAGENLVSAIINITDTSPPVITNLVVSPSALNEGSTTDATFSITFDITDTVVRGYQYRIENVSTDAADFTPPIEKYATTIVGTKTETGTFTITADSLTEGVESFQIHWVLAPLFASFNGVCSFFVSPLYDIADTSNNPLPPVPTLTGPACININATNVFTLTWDQPVTLDNAAVTAAFFAGQLQVNSITGSGTTYTINASWAGIPYNIVDSGASVMNGTNGLAVIRSYSRTNTPLVDGDDSIHNVSLPFPIKFPTSPTTFAQGTNIIVGTNSFISLGVAGVDYSGNGYPPSLTNPPIPSIFINTTDAGMFDLYAGSTDGGQTFIVRWEGVSDFAEGITKSNQDRVWEVVFYAAAPAKFTIRMGQIGPASPPDDKSFIKSYEIINGVQTPVQLFPKTGNMPLTANQYITVDAKFAATIPVGCGRSLRGLANTVSAYLPVPPC